MSTHGTLRQGIELGFLGGSALVYGGTEPVAIDAQAGKGKLTRFLGSNLVSPRTAHLTKIVTDGKDGELAWVSWKTLERQGYRVRFINADRLYGYPGETFNFNTRLLEIAGRPALRAIVGDVAYDAASFLFPVDPNPAHRWIGQGVRTMAALYYKITALHPSALHPCTPGGLWDFYGRNPKAIAGDLYVWASDHRMREDAGMCLQVAALTKSKDQWNAYASLVMERLRGFNVNNNQVNGSGDNLSEQSRPLLQVEDIRAATGGEKALLESRDHGFFTVDLPNFWERPEMDGLLRDVRTRPDKYAWLEKGQRIPALPEPTASPDVDLDAIMTSLRN